MSDLAAQETDPPPWHGTFIWYELMTSDRDAAIDFYRQVIPHWTAADAQMPEMGDFRYTILSIGSRGIAGLMELPQQACEKGAKPGWVGIIGVGDTDAAAKNIVAAGGAVLREPDDIPNVGRFAIVADPAGTVFEIMTPRPPEQEPPQLDPETPGKISWHELHSGSGQAAAFDFYSGQFGWKTEAEMEMGPRGIYRIFGKGGVQMGGMMDKPRDMPVSAWGFYVNVEGTDAAVERIASNGGQVTMGPHEVPGGSWIVHARDPQGAAFSLTAPRR